MSNNSLFSGEHQWPDVGNVHCQLDQISNCSPQSHQQQTCQQRSREKGRQEGWRQGKERWQGRERQEGGS